MARDADAIDGDVVHRSEVQVGQAREMSVVVVDDDEDVRTLVEVLLEVDDRFRLAGSAASIDDGVAVASAVAPDAIVIDLHLADGDGLHGVRTLRDTSRAAVVVFSEFPDPYTLLDALAQGADSYIDRGRVWSELLPAIAAACDTRAERVVAPPEPMVGGDVLRGLLWALALEAAVVVGVLLLVTR